MKLANIIFSSPETNSRAAPKPVPAPSNPWVPFVPTAPTVQGTSTSAACGAVPTAAAAGATHVTHNTAGVTSSAHKANRRLDPCLRDVVPLLQQLLRRHRTLNRTRILARCCPTPFDGKESVSKQPGLCRGGVHEATAHGFTESPDYASQDGMTSNDDDNASDSMVENSSRPEPRKETRDRKEAEVEESCWASQPSHAAYSPSSDASVLIGKQTWSHISLVRQYSSYAQVTRAILSIVRHLVPLALWGSAHNRNVFFHRLAVFVRLSRFQRFAVDLVMHGLRTQDCAWLGAGGGPKAHTARLRRLRRLVTWLFEGIVVPTLRAHFYATETGLSRTRTFFYRKPVWRRLHRITVASLTRTMLEPLPLPVARTLLSTHALGCSPMRFVPKLTGMRPIVNMSKLLTGASSVNHRLRSLFHALSFERDRGTQRLGASVFGMDDIYRSLKPFVMRVRGSCASQNFTPIVSLQVWAGKTT